jgi:hypothetical protein
MYTVQVFVSDYRRFGEPFVSDFILPQDEDSRFLQKLVITRIQSVTNQKITVLDFKDMKTTNLINATEDPWRKSKKSSDVQGSLLYVLQCPWPPRSENIQSHGKC